MSKRKKNYDGSPGGLTRRSFLKGVGITAAGSTVLSSGLLTQAADSMAPNVVGPGAAPISLSVNGSSRRVSVEPRMTLADVLRDQLGMTGTKVICDRGSCSGCTVWLDGVPVNSCMVFAMDVGERKITTVEALGDADHLHPLQAAFVDHDGMQCGYCTPGMVMSCAALLKRNPNPTRQDVQQAISGNICRCGTYPKVIEATLAAARSLAPHHAQTRRPTGTARKGA
jgi:aerobic-type carbon monoxide dehydrogenase small subunit (CoxS/CutS family)